MATETIARFIEEKGFEDLPSEAIQGAKKCILDCLGVTLAGSREKTGILAAEYVKELGGRPEAGVIGKGFKTSAPQAALANGILAHVLDYDDYSSHWGPGHPAVVLFPAIFALGEAKNSSGKEAIEAYVLGWEVGMRVSRGSRKKLMIRGWHPTSIVGSIAAAAACCKLLKLNSAQIINALGIAASEAGGLRLNFGTDTKSFHAGNAAQNGITAAGLSQKGFTASEKVLEQSPIGFCETMSGVKCDEEAMIHDLGKDFALASIGECIKPYPCCGLTHICIDAVLKIAQDQQIDPEKVSEINAEIPPAMPQILIHHSPQTGLEAKFSLEYCLAAALFDKKMTLQQFEEEKVLRPSVRKLMEKVKYEISSEAPRDEGGLLFPQTVVVKLTDGQSFSSKVAFPKGHDHNPMNFDEVVSKFRDCATSILSPEAIGRIVEVVDELDKAKDLSELMELATFTLAHEKTV